MAGIGPRSISQLPGERFAVHRLLFAFESRFSLPDNHQPKHPHSTHSAASPKQKAPPTEGNHWRKSHRQKRYHFQIRYVEFAPLPLPLQIKNKSGKRLCTTIKPANSSPTSSSIEFGCVMRYAPSTETDASKVMVALTD